MTAPILEEKIGALLREKKLPDAMKMADAFVAAAVRETFLADTPRREGILLEKSLHRLCAAAEEKTYD